MENLTKPVFAPKLVIPDATFDISFYINGLGAVELRRFSNNDGSIHVSELSINGTMFHLHQEGGGARDPNKLQAVSNTIGLFVDDVDTVIQRALDAGATLRSPAQNYDYGYRQGEFIDPFGHRWTIQKRI